MSPSHFALTISSHRSPITFIKLTAAPCHLSITLRAVPYPDLSLTLTPHSDRPRPPRQMMKQMGGLGGAGAGDGSKPNMDDLSESDDSDEEKLPDLEE